MTFILGLTGSIGMGKSTTAQLFAEQGCALWDADAAVHRLYAPGGAAVRPIQQRFPQVIERGGVSRAHLKTMISANPAILGDIEKIVHPLVARDRAEFLKNAHAEVVVLDIPLLFETGANADMDAVVCVTVSPELQKKRVLERGTMTPAQFDAILAKQMPDSEKQKRADYVICTDTLEHVREQVQTVMQDIRSRLTHA